MIRAAKPKLSLSVPTLTVNTAAASPIKHAAPKSPFPIPISISPISSPTARNTLLNQRGLHTGTVQQAPTFAYQQNASTKSILKRVGVSSPPAAVPSGARRQSAVAFSENPPAVKCVSPMPEDYYGKYERLTRDEKRWVKLQ